MLHSKLLLVGDNVFSEILDGEAVIGRGTDANVRVEHHEVSRAHAVLRRAGQILQIIDSGSANGTFVNGVAALDWTHVYPGDDVRLGCLALKIVPRPADRLRIFDDSRPTLPAPISSVPAKATMLGAPPARVACARR